MRPPSLHKTLLDASHRKNDYDDKSERNASMRLMKQLTGKRFVSFPIPNQPCVDIMSEDGTITAECELAKSWKRNKYPFPELHIPWRKGKPGGLRDMALGEKISLIDIIDGLQSWKDIDVYYCQISPDYLRAAVVNKATILKYLRPEHLKVFRNNSTKIYEHGDEFYFIPLSEVKIVNIEW
jgi:hypothetical protein